MSSPAEDTELKAGHPPAAKVGGMRVAGTRHKHNSGGDTKPAEDDEEFGTSPPKTDKHHQTLVVSGAVTKGDQDFPPQAVKSFHEKPLPAHDKRPNHPQPAMHNIHQPR